jgi:hypothetical protein
LQQTTSLPWIPQSVSAYQHALLHFARKAYV